MRISHDTACDISFSPSQHLRAASHYWEQRRAIEGTRDVVRGGGGSIIADYVGYASGVGFSGGGDYRAGDVRAWGVGGGGGGGGRPPRGSAAVEAGAGAGNGGSAEWGTHTARILERPLPVLSQRVLEESAAAMNMWAINPQVYVDTDDGGRVRAYVPAAPTAADAPVKRRSTVSPREAIAGVMVDQRRLATKHVLHIEAPIEVSSYTAAMHISDVVERELQRAGERAVDGHLMAAVKQRARPVRLVNTFQPGKLSASTEVVVMTPEELSALIIGVGDAVLAVAKENNWII